MTSLQYNPGGYDWIARWREMYDAEREQAERVTEPGFTHGSDYWAPQSAQFAAAARRVAQPDSFMRFLLPHLRVDDVLLNIGAGSGRHEPVLSRAAAQIVALEPSQSMRDQLERRIEEEQLSNVQIVADAWPTAAIPRCDILISSHVVYSVREIGPFLERMNVGAQRACFLFLAIRHPSSFMSPFWERFHGQPRLQLPGALECLNALYQLGIPARLTLVPSPSRFRFADAQEALADIRRRLRFTPDPARDAEIVNAIDDLLERDEEGGLTPRNQAAQSAVVWWTRTTENKESDS
jgi:hypothetical protein